MFHIENYTDILLTNFPGHSPVIEFDGAGGISMTEMSRVEISGRIFNWFKIVYGPIQFPKYRVTHQIEPNLPLTSQQKFCFGLSRPGQARPKCYFCFDVNRRFGST